MKTQILCIQTIVEKRNFVPDFRFLYQTAEIHGSLPSLLERDWCNILTVQHIIENECQFNDKTAKKG